MHEFVIPSYVSQEREFGVDQDTNSGSSNIEVYLKERLPRALLNGQNNEVRRQKSMIIFLLHNDYETEKHRPNWQI